MSNCISQTEFLAMPLLIKKYQLTANCGLGATSADDGQSAAAEVAEVDRAGRESCARDLEAVEALERVRSGATVVTTSLSYLKYLLTFFDFKN